MKRLVALFGFVATFLFISTVGVAAATPVTVGSGWHSFSFGAAGTYSSSGPFTYTSPNFTQVKVTDLFCKGDQFKLYNNDAPIGTTSVVPIGACPGSGTTYDPDTAYANPGWSHGAFILAPGAQSLAIQVTVSPFGSGGASYRVDTYAGPPLTKDMCKDGHFALYTSPEVFKNQGDCVSFVENGK